MILKSPSKKSNMQSEQPTIANLPPTTSLRPDIIGGQSLNTTRAYFDQDDKNIIVATRRGILYFSVESCLQIGQANLGPDKLSQTESLVSSDILDNLLYLFTNRSQVFVWNLETRDWSNQLTLPVPIEEEDLISCRILSKRQYIYTTRNHQTKATQLWYSMSRSERERPKHRDLVSKIVSEESNSFDIGCLHSQLDNQSLTKSERDRLSKQRCLTFIERSLICFQRVGVSEKFNLEFAKQRIQNGQFTCVRANSQIPMVAAGDTSGRIYVYTGDFSGKNIKRTKLHWHSLPVNDLCFSSTGHRLYSVGGEAGCVAVWDLSPNNIGQKHIIPRLGMPIRYINCSSNLNQLILSFEDNELQFMDTDGRTKELKTLTKRTSDIYSNNNVKALRRINTSSENSKSVGLLWHSKTDTVVTNARTGWLQFFSPRDRCKTLSLNFLRSRVMSLEKKGKVAPSEITRATFTLDGSWLAFYEMQESDGTFPEVKLHIWQRSSTTNRWGWVQTADRLHESTAIVDLKFSPDGQYLMSLNEDGCFHVLHRVCLDVKASATSGKQMYAKGFVGNVPEKLASMATFSHDSSVMAVSLKNDTTLIWMIVDPFKLVYECQLSQLEVEEGTQIDLTSSYSPHEVLGLHFGRHLPTQSVAPLCEVRSKSIRIWNVLNPQETMEFSITDISSNGCKPNEFSAVAFDHCSRDRDQFAVCTKTNQVLIFKIYLDSSSQKLQPLIVFDATIHTSGLEIPSYYTDMCFVSEPIMHVDSHCHSDPQLLNLVNRLCLMNNYQELIAITDNLTLEREASRNSCNSIKTVDVPELQAYFEKSVSMQNEETLRQLGSQKVDHSSITEKQRKIRNRLEVQKMIKDLLTRIPSQNLPKMEILGPMILDKLI